MASKRVISLSAESRLFAENGNAKREASGIVSGVALPIGLAIRIGVLTVVGFTIVKPGRRPHLSMFDPSGGLHGRAACTSRFLKDGLYMLPIPAVPPFPDFQAGFTNVKVNRSNKKMKIQASKTVVSLQPAQRAALKREAKRGLEFVLLMADVASANSKMSANAISVALADEFGLSKGYLNNTQKWAKDASLALKVALCDLRATVEAMPAIKTQGDLIALSAPEEEEEEEEVAEAGDGDDSEAEAEPVSASAAFGQAVETALKGGLSEAEMIAIVRSMAKASKPALKAAA